LLENHTLIDVTDNRPCDSCAKLNLIYANIDYRGYKTKETPERMIDERREWLNKKGLKKKPQISSFEFLNP